MTSPYNIKAKNNYICLNNCISVDKFKDNYNSNNKYNYKDKKITSFIINLKRCEFK